MRRSFQSTLLTFWVFALLCVTAHGESEQRTRSDVMRKSVTVLLSTDTSGYNLATALQYAVAQLFRETGPFNVQLSAYVLPGFSPEQTAETHASLVTDIFSFVYMEPERISLFLFDRFAPGRFVVASESLADPPGGELTSIYLENKLRNAFGALMVLYQNQQFQWLPGAEKSEVNLAENSDESSKRRAAEAGLLFRELTSLQQSSTYVGANFGMARFANAGSAASTVNFGAYFGVHDVWEKISLELGLEVFSYGLARLDARYRLPIAGKYVNLHLSAGVASILFNLTENRGFDAANVEVGQMLFGPGITFDIPLLGAIIRGGVTMYFGQGNILLGNYGVSYNINI